MSIDEVEATMNFSQALGFLSANIQNGTYISMHGVCSRLLKISKKQGTWTVFNSRVVLGNFFLENQSCNT